MRDALATNALRVGLFRFTLTPAQTLEVPAINKGNMLRGGFGHAFRRLCCIPQCKDAKTCPLADSCPYKAVFEPSPPPGADRLSKNQDIPRPFVFRAPQSLQTRYEKGERFEFGLVLIGRAFDFLPYFVLSFRELAAEGLGLNRARCTLERVEQIGSKAEHSIDGEPEVIYTAEDQLFHTPRATLAGDFVRTRLRELVPGSGNLAPDTGHLTPALLTVRFLTPTFLRADGKVIHRPEFHHLFKRVRDRINALSTFFGDGPLDVDFRALGECAEKVRTVSSKIEWVERFRTSSKTRQRHELSGLVGECTYEFPHPEPGLSNVELLKWLIAGEPLHAGRHAAWGNGWYRCFPEFEYETKGAQSECQRAFPAPEFSPMKRGLKSVPREVPRPGVARRTHFPHEEGNEIVSF